MRGALVSLQVVEPVMKAQPEQGGDVDRIVDGRGDERVVVDLKTSAPIPDRPIIKTERPTNAEVELLLLLGELSVGEDELGGQADERNHHEVVEVELRSKPHIEDIRVDKRRVFERFTKVVCEVRTSGDAPETVEEVGELPAASHAVQTLAEVRK